MSDFGKQLHARMASRGLGVRALARQVPCDPALISRIINGKIQPSAAVRRRLAELLGDGLALVGAGNMAAVNGETVELVRRLRASAVDPATLEALAVTTDTLCTRYSYADPDGLRAETRQWLSYVASLLDGPVGLAAHRELLVTAGWLTLLTGCLEYDSGLSSAAEATRMSALSLGREAGHPQIIAWALEMAAWFAHTRRQPARAAAFAEAGQEAAGKSGVAVQLIAHEARSLARMGDRRRVAETISRGQALLASLPVPEDTLNHFAVDPAKFDFYAMDIHRVCGNDDLAAEHAGEVLASGYGPDGQELSPMRMSEARIALAIIAVRAGDLDEAAGQTAAAFEVPRRCLPSLVLATGELETEMRRRYPASQQVSDLGDRLDTLRRSAGVG